MDTGTSAALALPTGEANERTPLTVRALVAVLASDDVESQLAAIEQCEADGELEQAIALRRYFDIWPTSHVCAFTCDGYCACGSSR